MIRIVKKKNKIQEELLSKIEWTCSLNSIKFEHIRIYESCYWDKEYETLFDSLKNKYKLQENSSLSYEKGIIKLTNFGLNFLEICIS